MDLDLTGRHALVCGGSDGIGRATAHELALLGAEVTVLARRADALAQVRDALPAERCRTHHALVVDMDDPGALRAAVEMHVAAHPVQILVNNTGGPPGGAAHAAAPEAFESAFRRHLIGGQVLVQTVLPAMRAARWGRIVNVVSTSVREPIANLGVSNTVRGAVAGWAKTLSRELASHGITVNNVLPGYTRTGRIDAIVSERVARTGESAEAVIAAMQATVPAGRFADAAETAAAIAFLCAPAAAYINGVSLPVDGGRMASI
ncbi:SDR family NAD(P)-dependent oxidoreductase [Luteimonas sp BLCC-B24]|uniref:SDR family NAD(P)-dependent oxidoreductase n=1 Tax=Luteimonas sp. BLCC-B24 TaxID=3025317 RepID=UPI00234CC90D|nr:SDR family NAD(P)-dependent oxidoreductase [Luteimonas sp. BLCC-B24]MDC7805439.1 SDR family NAD(P)-dependent oxidoreductase [Luteimonas sp. BLCC-B24]